MDLWVWHFIHQDIPDGVQKLHQFCVLQETSKADRSAEKKTLSALKSNKKKKDPLLKK